MRRAAVVVGCLLCLAGCGGGSTSSSGGGQGTPMPSVFRWGAARVPDPDRVAVVVDADGASVAAGAGQLLVTVRDDATEEQLNGLLEQVVALDGEIVGQVPGANLVQIQFAADADLAAMEREFAGLPGVEAVSLNEVAEVIDPSASTRSRSGARVPAGPSSFDGDYWMAQVRLKAAWARLPVANPWPSLGILDGGPKDLGRMVTPSRMELVDSQGMALSNVVTSDDHMTRVAALAAADGSTSTWGVAFGCRLFAVDVERPAISPNLTPDNLTKVYFARVVWGMDRLLGKGCRVINISMGPPNASESWADAEYYRAAQHFRRNLVGAVGEAVRRDALICIASGNEAKKHEDRLLPGNEPTTGFETNVLLVAANGAGDPGGPAGQYPAVQGYANEGKLVPITAPGEAISPGPALGADGGTSYSCPIVSGAAVAVMQAAPRLSAGRVRAILIETGSPNVTAGSPIRLLDLEAAIKQALTESP